MLLQDEYMMYFGIGDEYQKYMKLKYKRAVLMASFLDKGDMNDRQQILFLDKDIDAESQKIKGGKTFEEIYGWIVGEVGHLNLNKTSVYEYYSIVNTYLKALKKQPSNG